MTCFSLETTEKERWHTVKVRGPPALQFITTQYAMFLHPVWLTEEASALGTCLGSIKGKVKTLREVLCEPQRRRHLESSVSAMQSQGQSVRPVGSIMFWLWFSVGGYGKNCEF